MNAAEPEAEPAPAALPWLPSTPRSVAAMAEASLWRLAALTLAVALFAAGSCVWLASRHLAPAIDEAIANLPSPPGSIGQGRLHWPDSEPTELTSAGRGRRLHLLVDPHNRADHGLVADLQIELREHQIEISSIFGSWRLPYPPRLVMTLDASRLQPWWGSRKPFLLLGLGMAILLTLHLIWFLLSLVGVWLVHTVALFSDRTGGWGAHWRVALAALMPGAMLMGAGVVCYGLGLLPLLGLTLVFVLHLLVDWLYLFFSPFFLPRQELVRPDNPFDGDSMEPEISEANPFSHQVGDRE